MIYKRVLEELKYNKYIRESGKEISIPFPFERFSNYFPGIQKARYTIVTANSKVGKTKITDFLYCYNVVEQVITKGIKAKVLYFSLEVSKEDKIKEAICHRLHVKYGILRSPEQLSSMFKNYILDDRVLSIIQSKEFTSWIEMFERVVQIIDTKRSPSAIFNYILTYAANTGRYVSKTGEILDPTLVHKGDKETLEKLDVYLANDPDTYVIPIFDHGSLLSFQEDGYSDLRLALNDFSSYYCLYMRDRLRYSPVLIQQQAAAQESTENIKLNMLQPSASGLGDSKVIGRDCNIMLGLFAPVRYKIREYEGYDITKLRDHHRELSIILNRHGFSVTTQLYFNGASNYFCELPESKEFTNKPELYDLYGK